MWNTRCVGPAKLVTVVSFLVLLSTTYYLRREVLELNRIRFSADQARADYQIQQLEQDYPYEREWYEVAKKNYELQMKRYQELLKLSETDYEAYLRKLKEEYRPEEMPSARWEMGVPITSWPPGPPARPTRPRPPEYTRKLSEINAEFGTQKHHYFEMTSTLNWVAWFAAVGLVGGLLWLIMFDAAGSRLIYFLTLVLSFVFMIGPSFHSILSAIVGFLQAPPAY